MNFKSGPVKKSLLGAIAGQKPPAVKRDNPVVPPLGAIAGPSAGPAKRFSGIRGIIGKK